MKTEETLNSNEAAKMLGVTRATIYNWRVKGIIHNVSINPNKVEIPKHEIEDLLNKWKKDMKYV